jgi:hypothetical protein
MGKQALKYYAVLVGLGIVVAHGSGFGTAFSAGARGAVDLTRSLQGRG